MNLTDLIFNDGHPPLLKGLNSKEIEVIEEGININNYDSNRAIIKAGENGNSMYIIFQGIVNINHPGPNGTYRTTHQMIKGDFFGEMGLFADIERSASVVPVNNALIGEITRKDFDTIMEEHPVAASKILINTTEEMARRILYNNQQMEELYSRVNEPIPEIIYPINLISNDGYLPLFKRLNQQELEIIREKTNMKFYEPDSKVIKAGEKGDSLYIIFQGKVNINNPRPNDTYRTILQMTIGDFFGEMGCFAGFKRSADVVSVNKTLIGEITRRKFDDVMYEHPMVASKILYSTVEGMARRVLNNNLKIKELYANVKGS